MESRVNALGRTVLQIITDIGSLAVMIWNAIKSLWAIFHSIGVIVGQMYFIGVRSLWLITITSVFTGAVSAWQAAYQFKNYVPLRYLGGAVGKAVLIELAPVLTALVVAGRAGAGIAAELGSMKVTEQIDAMESMAVDPVRYLVMPRIIAGILMLPVLTIVSDFVAMLGAGFVSVNLVGLNFDLFMRGFKDFFLLSDLFSGLVKAGAFGFIISTMGCFYGFHTTGGAQGVGSSTTQAVVASAVLILVADYLIATLLFRI
jgi:phospholipid/cholesterol/gamma-HCH transport system permease protein